MADYRYYEDVGLEGAFEGRYHLAIRKWKEDEGWA
jgi:hypothetical protein